MAITTMDGLVAAIAGGQRIVLQKASITSVAAFFYTLWNAAGIPGAGSLSIGNTSAGVVPTDATTGAPTINAFGGSNTGYLLAFDASSTISGQLSVYDRLWHAGSFGTGTLQTFTLSSQPSYVSRIPGGDYKGTELWLEMNTAMGATATTVQVTYTNQDGTTGRTATLDSNLSSAPTQRMLPFRLQAGDTGIQRVDTVIVGGATGAGTFNIVVQRNLVDHSVPAASIGRPKKNAFDVGMPIVFADSCLALMFISTTTSTGIVFAEALIGNG